MKDYNRLQMRCKSSSASGRASSASSTRTKYRARRSPSCYFRLSIDRVAYTKGPQYLTGPSYITFSFCVGSIKDNTSYRRATRVLVYRTFVSSTSSRRHITHGDPTSAGTLFQFQLSASNCAGCNSVIRAMVWTPNNAF